MQTRAEKGAGLPEWPMTERLAAEKELLGFYVTGHPFNPYKPLVDKFGFATSSALAGMENRAVVRYAGLVSSVMQGISKKSNKPYMMASVEDLTGSVQILCMNENYEKCRPLLIVSAAVLVTGEINNTEDKLKIFPQEIMALEDVPRKFTKQVHFRLNTGQLTPAQLLELRDLVSAHSGKCPLFICLVRPAGELVFIEANERYWVNPSLQLQQAVEEKYGKDSYYAKADLTPPERVARKWERKASDGNGE
jgi:DNA polymerase-3 subunit alpha